MKHCPYCAEEIQDAAIVCKHCGRDLPVVEKARPWPSATPEPPAQRHPADDSRFVGVLFLVTLMPLGLFFVSDPGDKGIMALVLALVGIIAFGRSAVTGSSYRGAYLAAAMAFFAAGGGCSVLTPSPRDVAIAERSKNAAEARGAQVLGDNGIPIALVWLGGGFGALVGAALYRR